MDMADIYGSMDVNMKVNGNQIICMAKVFTLGRTAEGMKDSMNRIRNMVMVCMYGQMAGDMKEIGSMANNMERASISYQMELLR